MVTFVDAKGTKDVINAFDDLAIKMRESRTAAPKPPSNNRDNDDEEEEEEWEGEIQKGSHVRCVGCSRGAEKSVAIGDVGVVQKRDDDGDYAVNFFVKMIGLDGRRMSYWTKIPRGSALVHLWPSSRPYPILYAGGVPSPAKCTA